MIRLLPTALLAFALSIPASAQGPSGLTLEHRMLLRCSSAFALVAHGQQSGDAAMLGYPSVAERGREYFVQAMVRVMDDTGMARDEVAEQLTQEAQRLMADEEGIAQIMPACLASLADMVPAEG